MPFNPEMLVLAREVRARSQEELADESGVSQSKISKIEARMLVPSDDDIARFAKALRFPESFFNRSGGRNAPGSSCIFHRKKQSLPAKDLRRLHAHLDLLRIRVEQLLSGVDFASAQSLYRIDIDAFDGDAEQVASIVRQSWHLPPGPIDNLIAAIENAGGIVVKTSFGTDKIDALSQWARGLPPIFFVNADMPADRVRFSLAHELGHLIMHAVPTGDLETEADRFASELLMPSNSIAPELMGRVDVKRLAALKPRWRVSMQALAMRAANLGTITDRQLRTLYMTMSKLGWRKAEPVAIEPENPRVIPAILDVYFRQKKFAIADMTSLTMCFDEAEFTAEFIPRQEDDRPRLRLVE
jgi:Zn-dependent peptidase ImmA (M78 family)/transcriptional regulator with XRE-family HTH domain